MTFLTSKNRNPWDAIGVLRPTAIFLLTSLMAFAFILSACQKSEESASKSRPSPAATRDVSAGPTTATVIVKESPPDEHMDPEDPSLLKTLVFDNASELVARIDGMDVTRRMLAWYVGERGRWDITQTDVFTKELEDLKPLIRDLAVTLEGTRRADAEGILDEATLRVLGRQESAMLVNITGTQVVDERIPAPSEKVLREFYEENTASFTTPFHFSAYLIFISNYISVKAEANETLESLAQRVSGDAKAVENILTDTPEKSPRAPGYFSGNRDAIAPLEEGERLLAPMTKQQKEQNYERALQAKKRIEEGEDFTSVAIEISDSATRGELLENVGLSGRPPSEAVMQAALSTPEGETSDIFETKHGYNLLHIVEKYPETAKPFEEVREEVATKWRMKTRADLSSSFIDDLFRTKPDLKIDYAKLGDPNTPDDAVVASVGDKEYTKSELLVSPLGSAGETTSKEDLVTALKANTNFVRDIVQNEAFKIGIDKTPQYMMTYAGLLGVVKTEKYMIKEMGPYEPQDIPAEEVRQFFDANQEIFRLAPTYTYHVFGLKVEEGKGTKSVVDNMTRLLSNVTSRDAFITLIDRYSEEPGKHYRSGLVEDAPENSIHQAIREPLKTLEEGTRTEPIITDDFVISVFLVERKPSRLPQFSEVEQDVRRVLSEKKKEDLPTQIADRMLENVKIEYAF